MVVAGATASVRHLKVSQKERQAHADRVAEVRARFDALGIPHVQNPGHIIPVIVGDAVKCKFISDILMRDYGIYIADQLSHGAARHGAFAHHPVAGSFPS